MMYFGLPLNTGDPSWSGQCFRAYSTADSPTACGKTRQDPVLGRMEAITTGTVSVVLT